MRVHSPLHSRKCPSACSELWCQVEAVYKVCITKGHNKVCYRVPPNNKKQSRDFSIFHNTDSQLTEATMHSNLVTCWWCRRHFLPKNSSCPSHPPPQKTFTLFNLYRTLLLYRIPFILVSYLTTTSYSSIRDPRDLLDKIPPLPTTMHRLQLRLEGRTARH